MRKSGNVEIEVVAPHAAGLATYEWMDGIKVYRFRYFFPWCWQRVAYGTHWLFPAGLIGLILKKIKKKRLIYTAHSGGISMVKKVPFGRRFLSYLVRNCDRLTTVSHYNKKQIEQIIHPSDRDLLKDKLTVISMGVCRQSFRKEERSTKEIRKKYNIQTDKIVLFLGRLVPIKGVDFILLAMKGLENVTLIIAGEGMEKENLQILSRKLNIPVVFTGFIGFEAKRDLLNICDLMVLSSVEMEDGRSEAMPVTLMEGLSAGLPVVATDVGGVAEIIKDNLNGFLIPQRDSATMREKIRSILDDDDLKRRFEGNARKSSRQFDLGLVAQRYTHIYQKIGLL
jgi:glycosyltransferase involved in cell wall biosynthesis